LVQGVEIQENRESKLEHFNSFYYIKQIKKKVESLRISSRNRIEDLESAVPPYNVKGQI